MPVKLLFRLLYFDARRGLPARVAIALPSDWAALNADSEGTVQTAEHLTIQVAGTAFGHGRTRCLGRFPATSTRQRQERSKLMSELIFDGGRGPIARTQSAEAKLAVGGHAIGAGEPDHVPC